MAEAGPQPYQLFMLTELIGQKATNDRTITFRSVGVEAPLVTVAWLFGSLLATGVPALVLGLATPVAQYAVLIPMVLAPVITMMATMRSRRGMQLTHLQRTFNALAARPSRRLFVHLDRLYDPFDVRLVHLQSSDVPVVDLPDWEPLIDPERISQVLAEDVMAPRRRGRLGALSLKSARGAALDHAVFASSLMEAQRVLERREYAARHERSVRERRQNMLG